MICRICDATNLVPVLDLGLQPWANHFLSAKEVGNEPKYPLSLVYCTECSCVQLDYTVPKEVMFADHTYVSGTTKTLAQHFLKTAEEVNRLFTADRPHKSVLDIGSNDGTQLKQYKQLGFDVVGVESCTKIAALANDSGIPTVAAFFNEETAKGLGRKFDVINASGVFFHLEELHSATRGIKCALKDDGVFVIQFLYMKSIVENLAFDQIYHEHLLYYTLKTVERLLNRHGLTGFDGYVSPIHGGSMILYVTHQEAGRVRSARLNELFAEEEHARMNEVATYREFAARVAKMKEETLNFLERAKQEGKTIYGFGAPVKGNTFLNYCGIGKRYLDCLVEKNELRKGLYSPGMHIPLVIEKEVTAQPDIYFCLAWNFKEEILKNNQELVKNGVEFFFPVNPKG
ncbi:MAG: class I SAM-dependent methyltransferase [Proteobacteria bacterium]|nr:class I SAM-dependent methyltransferase [Pseudomonadota bacterium]